MNPGRLAMRRDLVADVNHELTARCVSHRLPAA
jgi:hypothetical protein